jgi:exodeoxyribonuclease V alpha subunit
MAAKLGIGKTALIRVRAGISYALAEAMDDGHCGLPAEELILLTQKLLEVPADLIATALDLELRDGTVIADDLDGRRCVFFAGLYRAEREVAQKPRALTARKPPWPSLLANCTNIQNIKRNRESLTKYIERSFRGRLLHELF